MDTVVRVEQLTKRYGSRRGVDDLSFDVAAGETFGLLGPNGAGKTTTIRLLLDLIRPSSGRVIVLGRDVRRNAAVHADLGYLPGELRLYDRLTGREHLRLAARLRRLEGTAEGERLSELLELDLDQPVTGLSKGNRQKVGLTLALMHRPRLLVLDEPTSGLDPLVQQVVHEVIREATGEGRTVLVSSHVLGEVQATADRVALLRDGRLAVVESVDRLRARARGRVTASFATLPPHDAFTAIAGVRELGRQGDTVELALDGPADPLVKALARYEVISLESREADLEDVFLALYRGDGHAS